MRGGTRCSVDVMQTVHYIFPSCIPQMLGTVVREMQSTQLWVPRA